MSGAQRGGDTCKPQASRAEAQTQPGPSSNPGRSPRPAHPRAGIERGANTAIEAGVTRLQSLLEDIEHKVLPARAANGQQAWQRTAGDRS